MSRATKEPATRRRIGHKLLVEFLLAIRFGLVGILATAIHIATLWMLLSNTLLPVLVANTIAFINAFGFSFAGNYLWTFGAPGSPRRAMSRFFTISVSAFALNSVLLGAILKLGWFEPALAAIGSAVVIPVITFSASRFWGFNYSSPASSGNLPEN